MPTVQDLRKAIAMQHKVIDMEHLRIEDSHAELQKQYHNLRQEAAPLEAKMLEVEKLMDAIKGPLLGHRAKLQKLKQDLNDHDDVVAERNARVMQETDKTVKSLLDGGEPQNKIISDLVLKMHGGLE